MQIIKLFDRDVQIETPIGKFLLPRLEAKTFLSKIQRKEVLGLTAHDIWALESFVKDPKKTVVANLPTASKVAAKSFSEMGILEISEGKIVITKLGKELLETAEKILEE